MMPNAKDFESILETASIRAAIIIWDKLRECNCVSIDACFAPHGTAHFIWLGEGEDRRCIATGNSFIEALYNAGKWLDGE